MIDDDVYDSLRRDQATKLTREEGAVSFSSVCNETLRRGLKLKK
jgi:hypothetical protein